MSHLNVVCFHRNGKGLLCFPNPPIPFKSSGFSVHDEADALVLFEYPSRDALHPREVLPEGCIPGCSPNRLYMELETSVDVVPLCFCCPQDTESV